MNPKKTGNVIATLRTEAGYTQKMLADALGVTDKAISKWERGLACPDVALLPKLSVLLDTDIESIINGITFRHESESKGVLVWENDTVRADACVYDKPLVYYLLGTFLLVGIRDILVIASHDDCALLQKTAGDTAKFGVKLTYCNNYDGGNFASLISSYPSFMDSNVLVSFGKHLLFGSNLTRILQALMSYRSTAAIMLRSDGVRVPMFYCPKEIWTSVLADTDKIKAPTDIIDATQAKKLLYNTELNRGIIDIMLNDFSDILTASEFVALYQRTQGQTLSDLSEIAENRGMTSKPTGDI